MGQWAPGGRKGSSAGGAAGHGSGGEGQAWGWGVGVRPGVGGRPGGEGQAWGLGSGLGGGVSQRLGTCGPPAQGPSPALGAAGAPECVCSTTFSSGAAPPASLPAGYSPPSRCLSPCLPRPGSHAPSGWLCEGRGGSAGPGWAAPAVSAPGPCLPVPPPASSSASLTPACNPAARATAGFAERQATLCPGRPCFGGPEERRGKGTTERPTRGGRGQSRRPAGVGPPKQMLRQVSRTGYVGGAPRHTRGLGETVDNLRATSPPASSLLRGSRARPPSTSGCCGPGSPPAASRGLA